MHMFCKHFSFNLKKCAKNNNKNCRPVLFMKSISVNNIVKMILESLYKNVRL